MTPDHRPLIGETAVDGLFVNTVIDFVIVALAVFLVIRGINRLRRSEPVAPAAPTT